MRTTIGNARYTPFLINGWLRIQALLDLARRHGSKNQSDFDPFSPRFLTYHSWSKTLRKSLNYTINRYYLSCIGLSLYSNAKTTLASNVQRTYSRYEMTTQTCNPQRDL